MITESFGIILTMCLSQAINVWNDSITVATSFIDGVTRTSTNIYI